MNVKLDITSGSRLTKETKNPSTGAIESSLCDLDGNPLASGVAPVDTLLDDTGKRWGRVAAQLPSLTDPVSQALKADILARNPVFFASDDGKFRGYYVPVNDFTYHEAAAA
jgi:hypothetical protein